MPHLEFSLAPSEEGIDSPRDRSKMESARKSDPGGKKRRGEEEREGMLEYLPFRTLPRDNYETTEFLF